jgi:hypothetical protein
MRPLAGILASQDPLPGLQLLCVQAPPAALRLAGRARTAEPGSAP